MYGLSIKPEADKIFEKLGRKDPNQLIMIEKKIMKIRENPRHDFKFLRTPLQGFNRVHIGSHFVLIFRIDHISEIVIIYFYGHHDCVYKWRPKVISPK